MENSNQVTEQAPLRILVYKLLNYANNSSFYLLATISVFAVMLTSMQLFPNDGELNILQVALSAFTIFSGGMLLWRTVINRSEYKRASRSIFVLNIGDEKTGTEKIKEALDSIPKNKVVDRLKLIRWAVTFAGTLCAFFLLNDFVAYSQNNSETIPELKVIVYSTVAISSTLFAVISTIFINKGFNKQLLKLEQEEKTV